VTPPDHPVDLSALYRANARSLFGVAFRITGHTSDAEDALQRAFLVAHIAKDRFRGEAGPSTWLYRIIVREACRLRAERQLRRERLGAVAALEVDRQSPDVATRAAEADERARVLEALDQLPEPQRLALALLQVRELPGEVIAEMLGVPLGTVYSRAFTARKRLAELLGACAPQPGDDRRSMSLSSAPIRSV